MNFTTDKTSLSIKAARFILGKRLAFSAHRIRKAIGSTRSVTFVRSHGNTGDLFIEAGIRSLLAGYDVEEVRGLELGEHRGHVAVIAGGGAWCQPYHEFMPELLPKVEERFGRVIVLPSSFDPSVPAVRVALQKSKAVIFAREKISFKLIVSICSNARLAHDCAFYCDLRKFAVPATPEQGVLNAFRTDKESRLLQEGVRLRADNIDVSSELGDLSVWLHTIARYSCVRTDRAHVMIAAALFGRKVEYYPSIYHKLDGIARYSLKGMPVRPLTQLDLGASVP